MDQDYLAAIGALNRIEAADPDGTQREGLKVVYTPMHGVGRDLIVKAFAQAGFKGLSVVPEQAEPDGEFPTVRFPNPEEPGAMDLSLAQAEREGANLIVANDPDADRLACIVRAKDGAFQPLTGNQIGVLLGTYLLERESLLGLEAPADADKRMVAASIVSSPQLGAAAAAMGVYYEETLTGFKWIANQALAAEAERGASFVFGYEEALGYTVGTVVRDKDGVSAAVILCELVAFLANRGETLLDRLDELARRTGAYVSGQRSTVFPGQEGAQTMAAIMEQLRNDPPSEVAGQTVTAFTDIQAGERRPLDGDPAEAIASWSESRVRSNSNPNPLAWTLIEASSQPATPSASVASRSSSSVSAAENVPLTMSRKRYSAMFSSLVPLKRWGKGLPYDETPWHDFVDFEASTRSTCGTSGGRFRSE